MGFFIVNFGLKLLPVSCFRWIILLICPNFEVTVFNYVCSWIVCFRVIL